MKLKKYEFEGKRETEVIEKALKELNVSSTEMYYKILDEEQGGLFKSKKIIVEVFLKEDIIEYIKKFLVEITNGMGVKINIDIQNTERFIKFNLDSDNNAILIGRNGKTIQSLQAIMRQALNNHTGNYINIIVNVEEYNERREENITSLAKRLAKEVKLTKIQIQMDNMNSYERRLVHSTLSNDNLIVTKSEGEEPNRYVVIVPTEE